MARKTISQRIALEGGKEIKDELKGLGEAGERAFEQIADAAGSLDGVGANFGRAMANLRDELGKVGTAAGKVRGSLRDLGGALGTVAGRTAAAGAALVGAAAGVVAFTRAGTELADAQVKAAQAAGVPIEAFGRLSFAAEQSGVSSEQLGSALNILNRTLGEVSEGNDTAIEKFRRLGVRVKGANGQLRPTEDILQDISDALSALPDGAEKSAIAIDLFGRSGSALIPLLNGGSQGLKTLGAEATALGIVFTREQATVAEAMNDALSALNQARVGVQSQLALVFAPAITEGSKALTEAIIQNRAALVSLAEQGLAFVLPLLQDFVNALIGNDEAVRSQWVLQARDNIIAFGDAAQAVFLGVVVPAYEALVGAAQLAADAINSITGGEITAQEILITLAVAKIIGAFGLIGPAVGLVVNFFKLLYVTFAAMPAAAAVVATGFAVIKAAALALLAPAGALAALIGWPALLAIAFAAAAGLIVGYFRDEIEAAGQKAYDFLVGLFSATGTWLSDGIASQIADIEDLWARIKDATSTLWADLKSGFESTWASIETTTKRFVDRISAEIRRLRDALRDTERVSRMTERQKQFDGMASGGYVSGPGTGTSDSILARLSNGEFVIRAAAVRHYGPQLLAALNSMRLPKGRLPGFNMGGLVQGLTAGVSSALPRYASGGLVAVPAGGGRPITLNIDGQTISGLTASPAAVEQIERFATSRLVRSTGRRPGWMGA